MVRGVATEPGGGSAARRSVLRRVAGIATALTGAATAAVTRVRHREPSESALSIPTRDFARRLQLALDAGHMGTWSWDLGANTVDWDDSLTELFGMERGAFDNTFDAWVACLHPDDCDRVLETIGRAVEGGMQFRFDHRIVWPDGSIHWLEGRGEPVFDDDGNVVGAIGVAIDIDERRRTDLERLTLLTSEQAARREAERSMQALGQLQEVTLGLSRATTVDDIAHLILERSMAALGAVTGYFATVDTEKQVLLLRSQAGYPPALVDDYRFVPVGAKLPAPEVLRTGEPMFVESSADAATRYPQFPRDRMHGAFVVYPLFVAGEPAAVVALGFDAPRRFDAEARAFVAAVVEGCAQALQRALLYEAEATGRDRLRTLLEASERLAGLDDPERQLAVVADIAATRIGRWATIHIVDRAGTRRVAAWAHATSDDPDLPARLAAEGFDLDEIARHVVATQEPYLDAEHEPLAIAVPMTVGARRVGVLTIGDERPGGLGAAELELALDLGRRSASAYERARLLRAEQRRSALALRETEERLAAEHRLVELLQQTILPEDLPHLPGVELAACYRAAETGVEVGGDWYDAFAHPDGGIVIVIGDVAGHGVVAATLMGRLRNVARAFALEDPDPARVLTRLDATLTASEPEAFATAIAAHFDPATGRLTWARAGHPPPLLCAGADAEYLAQTGGVPLGTMSGGYTTASLALGEGSLLLLFTDGLIEQRGRPIDEGLTWLASRTCALRDEPLVDVLDALLAERFGDRPSEDDVCVFAVRVGDAA
jgi:PAS domain S-box-containing protein